MNFMQIARLALPLLFFGFFTTTATAQSVKTNRPFSWKESADAWYMPKAYAFKYVSGDNAKESTVKI